MRSTAVAATPLCTHLTGTVTTLAQRLELGLAGRYTIEREPGQGGMAVVYAAVRDCHRAIARLVRRIGLQ
jgi:hypothetical protein